jgi:hypothetical protein
MNAEDGPGGLHIDSDWKEEAAREKEKLAAQEQAKQETAGPGGAAADRPLSVLDIMEMLGIQAMVGLGAMQGADGQRIPANPPAAKLYIDLLDILVEKTKGNVTEEESRAMQTALYELRMSYVQVATGGGQAPAGPAPDATPNP